MPAKAGYHKPVITMRRHRRALQQETKNIEVLVGVVLPGVTQLVAGLHNFPS